MRYDIETITTYFAGGPFYRDGDDHRAGERAQTLESYGREGFELKSTVTIPGGDGSTAVIDTLQRQRP